jgi:hypothetical protein
VAWKELAARLGRRRWWAFSAAVGEGVSGMKKTGRDVAQPVR